MGTLTRTQRGAFHTRPASATLLATLAWGHHRAGERAGQHNVALDPACGHGALLHALARTRPAGATVEPHGADSDPDALRAAQTQVPGLHAHRPTHPAGSLGWLDHEDRNPLPQADLVTLNAPYTRHELQDPAQRAAEQRASTPYGPTRTAAFTALAMRQLRPHGTLAMLAPLSLATAPSAAHERAMLTDPSRGTLSLILTSHDPSAPGWSEDTRIPECMLIWRQTPAPAGHRVALVSLWRQPTDEPSMRALGRALSDGGRDGENRRGTTVGQASLHGHPWPACVLATPTLDLAYRAATVDAAGLSTIGAQGWTTGTAPPTMRGRFRKLNDHGPPAPGERTALWGDAGRAALMHVTPNTRIAPKRMKTPTPASGTLLLPERLQWRRGRTTATLATTPTCGHGWHPLRPPSGMDETTAQGQAQATVALLNSTLGLLAWLRQRCRLLDYPYHGRDAIMALPMPAPGPATETLATLWSELRDAPLGRYRALATDPVRRRLDDAVGELWPGIGRTVEEWRQTLQREPSLQPSRSHRTGNGRAETDDRRNSR